MTYLVSPTPFGDRRLEWGYTSWAGGAEAWKGSEPWSGKGYSEKGFVLDFKTGAVASPATAISTSYWVEEP